MSNYAVPPPPPPATRAGVATEVQAEIQGQIAPLESEAAGFARAEGRAIEDLNSLFSGLLPFVAGSAQRVAESYGATNAAQASIFEQAWSRLNSLRGDRAGDAQALAQQLGAPIPIDMFTKAVDIERGAFVPEAAGELLKASSIGKAGVQEAEAFAGRVFPLKKARMAQKTHQYYRDQITDLRKQIAAIKAMKPGLINERLRARQLEDYQMRLSAAEARFQQFSTKKSLELEQQRIKTEQEQVRGTLAVQKKELRQNWWLKKKELNMAEKQMAQKNNRTAVATAKQNIIAASNAIARQGPQKVDEYILVRNELTGELESKHVTRTIPGRNIKNPTVLLNEVVAQVGIHKNQKELYNFAVAQVLLVLRTMGLRPPEDPKKWPAWWKKRNPPKSTTANPIPKPSWPGR